jgi:hypothetical protein
MTELYIISEEELKEIIEDTEDMCNAPGWVIDVQPIANRRMDKINKIRSRPPSSALLAERERVLKPIEEYTESLRDIESSFIKFRLKEIIESLRSEQP